MLRRRRPTESDPPGRTPSGSARFSQWQRPGGTEVVQWLFWNVFVPVPSHCRSSVLPNAWLRATVTPVDCWIEIPVGFPNTRLPRIDVPFAPVKFRIPNKRLLIDRLWKTTLFVAAKPTRIPQLLLRETL